MVALPLLLAVTESLVARLWPEILLGSWLTPDHPPNHPFGFRYSLDQLALLLILLAGSMVGVWRGIPAWSYTWIVLAIFSILTLVSALLPVLLLDALGGGAVTMGWLVTSPYFAGSLLILIFAASRVRDGMGHVFFIAAVYLAFIALRPYINFLPGDESPVRMVANTASVLMTVLMLVVALTTVMRFTHGDATVRRRSIYVLIAVALAAPILTGLILVGGLVASLGPDVSANAAGIFGLQLLSRWALVAASLLITWALAILFIRIGRIPADSAAPPSGETHAS